MRATRRRAFPSVVAVLALTGCMPRVVWSGTDAARRTEVRVLAKGEQQWLSVNGEEKRRYDAIGSEGIRFSRDGRRVAYAALRGGKWFMVVDGKEEGPWSGVAEPHFSRDGAHFAYQAETEGGGWRVVRDGVPGAAHREIDPGSLNFSPDGNQLAYATWEPHCMQYVVVGAAGPSDCFEGLRGMRVTKRGTVVAVARKGERESFYDGAGLGPAVTAIDSWSVTDDGQRYLYAASHEGKVLLGTNEGLAETSCRTIRGLRFGDGGRRTAYSCIRATGVQVVVDGRASREFSVVERLALANHGPHYAYVGRDERGTWVVTEGGELGPYDEVTDLELAEAAASGSGRLAYVSRKGGSHELHHGEQVLPLDAYVPGSLVLTANGSHCGFVHGDRETKTFHLYVDGKPHREIKGAELFVEDGARKRAWLAGLLEQSLRP